MKTEHLGYLKVLGIKEPIKKRIEEIHKFFLEICPQEIEDIFISEHFLEDGTRVYDELRFYSKDLIMIAQDFLLSDTFTMSQIEDPTKIYGIKFTKKEYDFKKANEKSRMKATIGYTNLENVVLSASKENCDYLKSLVQKKYLPLICKP